MTTPVPEGNVAPEQDKKDEPAPQPPDTPEWPQPDDEPVGYDPDAVAGGTDPADQEPPYQQTAAPVEVQGPDALQAAGHPAYEDTYEATPIADE